MKLLSIGVAAYNMEKYLDRCITSLLSEDILKYIEIIIVNNASIDLTSTIAHRYGNQYPDIIKVIDVDINGHYGKAVNLAIENAMGKYFRLLDADDWYDTYNFERFVKHLYNNSLNVDIIVTNYEMVGNSKQSYSYDIPYNIVYNLNEFSFIQNKLSFFSQHSVTYKTSLLHGIKLQEGLAYVDIEYCILPYIKSSSIIYLNYNIYRYFIGREGQTVTDESYVKNISALRKISLRLLPILKNIHSDNIRLAFYSFLPLYYHYVLLYRITSEYKILQKIDLIIKKEDFTLYKQLSNKIYCRIIPYISLWRYNQTLFFLLIRLVNFVKSVKQNL